MRKCMKCKTVFHDDYALCPYCGCKLADENSKISEDEPPSDNIKNEHGIIPTLIYTAVFILFIAALYYFYYYLMRR